MKIVPIGGDTHNEILYFIEYILYLGYIYIYAYYYICKVYLYMTKLIMQIEILY